MVMLHSGEKIEARVMIIGGDDNELRKELGIIGREFSHH
jgi:hypothetical protein